MFDGGTRDTNVTTAVNSIEKQAFENLADAYNCSQAAMNRMVVLRAHRELFGDIHPKAVPSETIDTEALLNGDLEPEDVDERFRMDGDAPAQVPTADGGIAAQPTPSSYTPTYTPQDLAESGSELTWDELTDALTEHWSAELEIHPDRVRASGDVDMIGDDYSNDPYALRASKKPVAKIITGILRSNGDVVPEKLVEAMILQYTEHQITRADEAAGRRYKKSEYKRLLVDEFGFLVPHPDPLKDEYYTSEGAAKELFAEEVSETIAELVDTTWVLDPREHVQQTGVSVKENPSEWLEDLAEFRQGLGFLQAVTSDDTWGDVLEELDDPTGKLPNAEIAARKTYNDLLQQYVRVNQWARFAVGHAILDVGDDVLVDEVSTGDDWKEVNADNPAQPVTEWVTRRDEPLSPQAQIEAVAEKL